MFYVARLNQYAPYVINNVFAGLTNGEWDIQSRGHADLDSGEWPKKSLSSISHVDLARSEKDWDVLTFLAPGWSDLFYIWEGLTCLQV